MADAPDYAFPHTADDESRRLEGARCLEIGGGRGSITRWLSGHVGPEGHATATDLQLDFLAPINEPNVEVLRHDQQSLEKPGRWSAAPVIIVPDPRDQP